MQIYPFSYLVLVVITRGAMGVWNENKHISNKYYTIKV